MRYLNKIIFINSAHIRYAEINLDGNIHFTGTQGVGKSTLLRAILFFYNADTGGLGIPKSKDSYTDYYFKNANSYIVYEVTSGESKFCVVSYKSQHKVCFRFFDGAYQVNYFVNENKNVPDSWEGIAQRLDAYKVFYTKRKIDEHKEYRDIIYGNHDGKKNELKRYALLESKEYQNIPKTIQNVFLNSKMEAEFIKQTIIMSLENDIRIDLNQHAHHLKGFETQLADIRKFKMPNTLAQANSIAKLQISIKHLEREKIQLAKELVWAINQLQQEEPNLKEDLAKQNSSEQVFKDKLNRAYELFKNKERKIAGEISVFEGKLKEAKAKELDYERKNITYIIEKVALRPSLEKEQKNLLEEKELLTMQFKDLSQKYQALLEKFSNQYNDFLNGKNAERNTINAAFLAFKEDTRKATEKIIAGIRTEHKKEIDLAREVFESKKQATYDLKLKKEGIKHKRYFEKEIEEANNQLAELAKSSSYFKAENENDKREIETLEKQWSIDEKDLQQTFERAKEKCDEQITVANNRIKEIDAYIDNHKSSLYGWLTEQYPDWENTIGKVIDVNVLFNADLSPKLLGNATSFYGVELDLNEITTSVKTVADYEQEQKELNERITTTRKNIAELTEKLTKDKDNLKSKYKPKIRKKKEAIKEKEYFIEQHQTKLAEWQVKKNDLMNDAVQAKNMDIERITIAIEEAITLELAAKKEVENVEAELDKLIKTKEKERDKKIEKEGESVQQLLVNIEAAIIAEKDVFQKRKAEINLQKENELAQIGADTNRLSIIENRLDELGDDLEFIENKRDLVSDYHKDKRELFDKVPEFKDGKQAAEKQLELEEKKFQQQREGIQKDLDLVKSTIDVLQKRLKEIQEDHEAFAKFNGSTCYHSIEDFFVKPIGNNKTEKSVKQLIEAIKDIFYEKLQSKIDEIRKTSTDFLGKFSEENIFKFPKQPNDEEALLSFAEMLSDFIEEKKIERIEKEVNERFSFIITTIGKQTNSLVAESGKIQTVINKINNDFLEKNFAGVIKKIELKIDKSKNEVVQLLILIKEYNDENSLELGVPNLFSSDNSEKKNKDAIDLLKQFVKKIAELKRDYISLSDSFELKFRIEENQNDTGWVEKLSNVGSEGTDVLVKAMLNIMLLNVFKEGAAKRGFKEFKLHCMMDEIGKLHPNNVRGILKFAADRNIMLINGSPIENDALAFKHIYELEKDGKSFTKVKRILSQY